MGIWAELTQDLQRYGSSRRERRSAFLFNPGFKAVFTYRLIKVLERRRIPFVRSWLIYNCFKKTGVTLSAGAVLGRGLYMPHGSCIVFGSGVVIGENVSIYQGVTFGSARRDEATYPVVEDDVVIFAGASILGNIRIGKGAVIGANAVVLRDVPPGATAVGVPARTIPPK